MTRVCLGPSGIRHGNGIGIRCPILRIARGELYYYTQIQKSQVNKRIKEVKSEY